MPVDDHDILIWDSEIRRPRNHTAVKRQGLRHAAFILDEPPSRGGRDEENRPEEAGLAQGTAAG